MSGVLELENAECRAYLPEAIPVSTRLMDDLNKGRRRPDIEALAARLMVLDRV